MSKSYDLSTSSKWASLADGDHSVTIKAKGAGFGDSSFSNSVTVTKAAAGETWVLNESIDPRNLGEFSISFKSNNKDYIKIEGGGTASSPALSYFYGEGANYDDAYGVDSPNFPPSYWYNQSYRTITFNTVPTGALLTWLQANGTKQGGGVTEHTLTFNNLDSLTVTVDGASVTSPYTLTKDCTIVAYVKAVLEPGLNSPTITINEELVTITTHTATVNINNSDVSIFATKGDTGIEVTINYTA